MEKYLNMSSYFVGNVSINADGQICDDKYFRGSTDIAEDYYELICHAFNSHDELVAMNKELLDALELLDECYSDTSREYLSRSELLHHKAVRNDVQAIIDKAKAAS